MPDKNRLLLALAVALALFTLVSVPAVAQVLYGSILGTIEDPSGAVVPNATVTIINKSTGLTRETTADASGRFTIPNVLAGVYDVKVTAAGFKTTTRPNLDVTINTVSRADFKLEVGGLSESVSVSAEAVQLQTDKSDVRHAITSTAMTSLPLGGYRNYQTLLNLVPGATPAAYQNAVVDTPSRSLAVNVNGTAKNINNTLIDGAANTFIWLPHHTYYIPAADSIQEVNITTGSFDAEQGLAGGASVTVISKSGTNELHGTGTWYHQNQHFNAAAFRQGAAYKKPLSIYNQANGTIGGPIKKDKLFYFFSYERTAERTGNWDNYSTPPLAWRDGNLSSHTADKPGGSTIYDPASSTTPAGRLPFANNIIPQSRISPIFQKIVKQLPVPNQISVSDPAINLGGTYFASSTMKLDRHQMDVKVNYNPTQKLSVWGKFAYMTAPVTGNYLFGDLGGPAMGTDGFGDTKTYIPTVGFTYTISPTFLMDGVFGITRFDQHVGIPGEEKNVGLDVWGIPGTNGGRQFADDPRYGGVPYLEFGFSNVGVGATWAPLFRHERTYEYRTNFSKLHGAHELRWGFEPRRYQMSHWQPETANPRGAIYSYSGATNVPGQTARTGNTFATALLGLASEYRKSIQNLMMETREWQFGTYFQDRWQVTRKLTLNLGLRYEYFPLINRGDRGIERWDPFTNTVYLGGFGDTPRSAGMTVSKKLFSPRLGFAYRLSDNNVIRAGYGITYNAVPFSRPLRGLYPATVTGGWTASTPGAAFQDSSYGWYNTYAEGIPDVPTPDLSAGTLKLPNNLEMGPASPWGGQLNRGYVQSWNFTVERKLPLDMVLSTGYVATRTIRQTFYRNINTSGIGMEDPKNGGSANRVLAKLYGRTATSNMWDGVGYAAYDSWQTSLNKNFTKGLFLKAAYTWGKALNMTDEDGWTGPKAFNWEPMFSRNYSPAGYDRTHMFTLGWVYELPVGKGKWADINNKALDLIVGGWKVNGIFSAYSGNPFTVGGDGNSLRCNGCTQTADLIAPVKIIDTERGPDKPYYDPNSFMDPMVYFRKTGIYRPGSMGINVLRNPGYWRVDPAFFKEFKFKERFSTEFRVEVQNLPNHPLWWNGFRSTGANGPNRDADGNITRLNNFMALSDPGGLRTLRLGLRFQF